MSDCSANAWHVPEQREPGVLYMHGHPNVDYSQAKEIEVDGQRFTRLNKVTRIINGGVITEWER